MKDLSRVGGLFVPVGQSKQKYTHTHARKLHFYLMLIGMSAKIIYLNVHKCAFSSVYLYEASFRNVMNINLKQNLAIMYNVHFNEFLIGHYIKYDIMRYF